MTFAQLNRRDFLLKSGLGAAGLALPRPGKPATDVRCIVLQLTGGPSQLDTWDMKPDAPAEIRGPFRPIKTNVPGIEISENFPRMARHADKFSIVRSVFHTAAPVHEISQQLLPGGLTVASAADSPAEPEWLRERYGRNRFGQNCLRARQLIEAGSRLVTVKMFDTVERRITWDIHGWKPFSPIGCYRETVGPMFDMAYSSLLEDLHQRGLLTSTIVVATGEFGRTPKINIAGGRDHWTQCWSLLIGGGPIKMGQVFGSSDRIGAEPKDLPVALEQINATLFRALGIGSAAAEPVAELFV